jgi:NAD(P)-dependent dehydrogenase (short-subunit alcohol dehydrogenase family)
LRGNGLNHHLLKEKAKNMNSIPTVFITGASSGIGKATALLFQQRGWQVAATMRSPEQATDLQAMDRVLCLRLDVTDPDSIATAVSETLRQFGDIDVVVNNAGYALMGPFEAFTLDQIQQQFATNVFGLMAVTQAILPHWRSRRQGTLINVSSMGGRLTFPLYSLYHATKWSVEGFSESLQYELAPFNIRVKVVEPGPIQTDFYARSADRQVDRVPDYAEFYQKVMPRMDEAGQSGSPPMAVATIIFQAATDNRNRLRYAAGQWAGFLLMLRKLLPEPLFFTFIRQALIR